MSDVIFTMDIENPDKDQDDSFVEAVDQVLDWLNDTNKRGTFFVVGELARRYPELITRISEGRHEIGLHGLQHVPVGQLTPDQFRQDTALGKQILEDLTGKPVLGYRAPMFSLNQETAWASQILSLLGFNYSSSVLPAANPRFSMPGAPREVFRWPDGLIEIPAPVTQYLGLSMPFLGGIYFRYFPNWIIHAAIKHLDDEQVRWFYCHPYDFRLKKKYIHMIDTPLWVNILLMLRRKGALQKMQRLFQHPGINHQLTLSDVAQRYQSQTA